MEHVRTQQQHQQRNAAAAVLVSTRGRAIQRRQRLAYVRSCHRDCGTNADGVRIVHRLHDETKGAPHYRSKRPRVRINRMIPYCESISFAFGSGTSVSDRCTVCKNRASSITTLQVRTGTLTAGIQQQQQ